MDSGEGPAARERMRATIFAFPGQPLAVVDGAHFEDVTLLLKRKRLFARSLFLDTADEEVRKAGPWIVKLDQSPDAADQVLSLVGQKPAAVYWSCRSGETVLYRHLRTINLVRLPAWAASGRPEPPDPSSAPDYQTVSFRHFDPRVLADLMPCLDAAQFKRVLGPADEMAFLSTDSGRVRRIVAPSEPVPEVRGLLTIRSDQAFALAQQRNARFYAKMRGHLKETAPDQTKNLDDASLDQLVQQSRGTGERMGLTTDRAHAKWAYLMLMTDSKIAGEPWIKDYVGGSKRNPNTQMDLLMRSLIAAKARLGDPA